MFLDDRLGLTDNIQVRFDSAILLDSGDVIQFSGAAQLLGLDRYCPLGH